MQTIKKKNRQNFLKKNYVKKSTTNNRNFFLKIKLRQRIQNIKKKNRQKLNSIKIASKNSTKQSSKIKK